MNQTAKGAQLTVTGALSFLAGYLEYDGRPAAATTCRNGLAKISELELSNAAKDQTIARLRVVLEAVRSFKPFHQHFNHCGFMNSTQLSDRDLYLSLMSKVDAALSEPRA